MEPDVTFLTRRQFLKGTAGVGGIWVVHRALAGGTADAATPTPGSVPGWSGAPGQARYRVDGLPKVRGQKVYAIDLRARDMKGWPSPECYAMVLRTNVVGRPLLGIDLSVLPPELRPLRVVTAADLERDRIRFPRTDTYPGTDVQGLFVGMGQAATFLGQPVAILLFEGFGVYRKAHRILHLNPEVLRFGEPRGVAARAEAEMPCYAPPTYLTRYAEGLVERFSQVKDGFSNPYCSPSPGSPCNPQDEEARRYRACIERDLGTRGWRVFEGTYETQVLDPVFLEPENGLAWLERDTATLHMVIGTQSPDDCINDTVYMFGEGKGPIRVERIVLDVCDPGGGFGGRDISTFPTLLALAAAYADRPVRLVHNRAEQFQSGLKQLGATIHQRLAVDASGRFQAIVTKARLHAGGVNNYSQWVAQLTGYCAGGAYDVPRVSIDAEAFASVGVIAGSMRGFGGPQAYFAAESLVDEVAVSLGRDPIELREQNALARGGRTVTGYRVTQSLRLAGMCRLARSHPLWTGRERARREHARRELLYGVGFALANQAYGTNLDAVMAAVELDEQGNITVATNAVDMGNGSATSLALSTATVLGENAHRIEMGSPARFTALELSPRSEPAGWANPHWTPGFAMASSACITAFQQVHVVRQASLALLELGLLPVARQLWGLPPGQPLRAADVRWEGGALVSPGRRPLPRSELARRLHAGRGTTGAMVHAYHQGRWVESSYDVEGLPWSGPVDGLSTRSGDGWVFRPRVGVVPPAERSDAFGRSLYAPSASLVAVEVDPRTGRVKVVAAQSYLEAGRVIQPDLVLGQYYGGFAMGVGYALMEYLPPTFGGAGMGDWNLDRYEVPRASDLPLDRLELHLMEPLGEGDPPRGIAEAVLCPVAGAIANAVAHATGHRFRSLPITAERVLEALQS